MARPKKIVDVELIQKLAEILCTNSEIAAITGVSEDTLTRRYADRIKKGKEIAKASLRRMQFQAAQKGSYVMLIWLGKQYLNQKEKIDFSEADGFEFSEPDKV